MSSRFSSGEKVSEDIRRLAEQKKELETRAEGMILELTRVEAQMKPLKAKAQRKFEALKIVGEQTREQGVSKIAEIVSCYCCSCQACPYSKIYIVWWQILHL